MKAFLTSRAALLQELRNLGKAINETVDLTGLASQHDESKFLRASTEAGMETANGDSQVREKMYNVSKVVYLFYWNPEWLHLCVTLLCFTYTSYILAQVPNGTIEYSDDYLYSLQNDELYRLFHSLGDQILYLWSTFLKFHRFIDYVLMLHLLVLL